MATHADGRAHADQRAIDSGRRRGQAPAMSTRRVSWRRSDSVRTDEHCTISIRDAGLSLVGTVVGADGGLPVRIEYQVITSGAGASKAAHVRDYRGFGLRQLALGRDARGNWSVNGAPARELRGCVDVDLGCTPATNTLPIRRLHLALGASATVEAALVRFPDLTVERAAQTYTRLDEFTYRYASGTFEGELAVDDDGVVTAYAPWERTGFALGPDDTEPLDVG